MRGKRRSGCGFMKQLCWRGSIAQKLEGAYACCKRARRRSKCPRKNIPVAPSRLACNALLRTCSCPCVVTNRPTIAVLLRCRLHRSADTARAAEMISCGFTPHPGGHGEDKVCLVVVGPHKFARYCGACRQGWRSNYSQSCPIVALPVVRTMC